MITISRLILVLSLLTLSIQPALTKEGSPKIGKVLEDLLGQSHEYRTYKFIQEHESKTCINNEEKIIEAYTDQSLFSKAWEINCTIITTSNTCSKIKKEDLHDCSKPQKQFSLSNAASNFKACYSGVKKSWKEWFKFIKQAATYITNEEARTKTNTKVSKAYKSFKSYLALEVTKHQQKYNSTKEAAFAAVSSSLLNKVIDGVKKMLTKAIPQVGCYNQAAKTRFTCQILAEFFAEPIIMFKFVKIGLKALKGTKISKLIKKIRVPKIKKSIAQSRKSPHKNFNKNEGVTLSDSPYKKLEQDIKSDYSRERESYLNDPRNQNKTLEEQTEELKGVKNRVLLFRSHDIRNANIEQQKVFKNIGIETEIVKSGAFIPDVTALKFKPSRKTTNQEALKLMKYQKRFGTDQVTFDIAENIKLGSNGFSQSWIKRIDLGTVGIDEIVKKGDIGYLGKHEFTHAAFVSKREKGVDSIYHSSYTAKGGKKLNANGFYDNYMSSEEMYTFSNQPYWKVNTLLKEVTNKGNDLPKGYVYGELTKIINDLNSLKTIQNNSTKLSNTVITGLEQALKTGSLKKGSNIHLLNSSGKIAK